MKFWIDKYEFEESFDLSEEFLIDKLKNVLEYSDNINFKIFTNKKMNISSSKNEWLMYPSLPKYSAIIIFNEGNKSKTNIHVSIKGNPIIRLFKYLGILLFLAAGFLAYISFAKPEMKPPSFIIINWIGSSLFPILMNYWDRNNLSKGLVEINNILSKV